METSSSESSWSGVSLSVELAWGVGTSRSWLAVASSPCGLSVCEAIVGVSGLSVSGGIFDWWSVSSGVGGLASYESAEFFLKVCFVVISDGSLLSWGSESSKSSWGISSTSRVEKSWDEKSWDKSSEKVGDVGKNFGSGTKRSELSEWSSVDIGVGLGLKVLCLDLFVHLQENPLQLVHSRPVRIHLHVVRPFPLRLMHICHRLHEQHLTSARVGEEVWEFGGVFTTEI